MSRGVVVHYTCNAPDSVILYKKGIKCIGGTIWRDIHELLAIPVALLVKQFGDKKISNALTDEALLALICESYLTKL